MVGGGENTKSFCQLYSAHIASVVKGTVRGLEREISLIEDELVKKYDAGVSNLLERKRKDLGSYLYEQAKGALIRARVSSIKDMDAPTAFFFNLERKGNHQNPMQFLQHPEGHLTSVPAEMRKIAVDFYTDLYSVDPGAEPFEPSTQQAQETLAEQAIEPTSTTSVPKGVKMVKRKKWQTSELLPLASPSRGSKHLHSQDSCGASSRPHMVTGYFTVPGKTAGDLGAAVGPRDAVCRPTSCGHALTPVNHCPSYGQIAPLPCG
ncbi:hypothetical protein MHYP_G00329500 [Metynnis hypsauchen]